MGYPNDLLSEREEVVVHSHPHFKMLIFPVIMLLVTLGAGIWLAMLAKDTNPPWDSIWLIAIGAVGLLLIIWLVLAPFVRWRTTHFIVTTDRLIVREGVIKRTGIDIPMSRINSVQFEHGLMDRIFGCGTLIVESASDEPLRFDDIPNVERVHTVIYREVNDNPYDNYTSGAQSSQTPPQNQAVAPQPAQQFVPQPQQPQSPYPQQQPVANPTQQLPGQPTAQHPPENERRAGWLRRRRH